MGQMGNAIRKLLYKNLSLDSYLRVLSGMYLQGYLWGVSPRSEVYEYPRFLKDLVSPGDMAIDIGANLGYYSYVLAGLAGPSGKVYAVEPVRPILNVLRRNLRKYRNVEILNYALGDAEKTIRMGNSSVGENGYFGTGQNFVMDRPTDGLPVVEFEAEMRRGSVLFADLPKIDFIKCDIEGYEGVVIPELRPLIERHLPTVLIETGGDTRTAIADFFESRGYLGFTLCDGRMKPLAPEDTKDIIFIHIRDYTFDKHRQVDDYPFGGEAGMVMKPEPIFRCVEALQAERSYDEIIYTSPDGVRYDQHEANRLSTLENIVILCGHYKGIDYRVREHLITREISIGDYVLTGGELAAAIIADSVIRIIPGAIGDEASALTDSFQDNLLAPPVYTRPAEFRGWRVPDVLLSGNFAEIDKWQEQQALERTERLRPDLLK